MLKLPKFTIKRIMKEVLKEENFKISLESMEYMVVKATEFIENLTRNAIPTMKEDGRRTISKKHLEITLDRKSLILKNLPKVDYDESLLKPSNNEGIGSNNVNTLQDTEETH